ncbi:hypothetical protein [uncultured Gimesia sp.]|uniref:hypothetical protein n=1 Tax=uncultured Gimesia sp. TaxID=1678688 RepID=UPI0030D8FB81
MSYEKVTIKLAGFQGKPSKEDLGIDEFKVDRDLSTYYFEGPHPGPADVFETVLVAFIAAGAGVLSAAITGVFTYLANHNGGKIVIKGANGRQVEVPEGTSNEELDEYIQKAREIDANQIEVKENSLKRNENSSSEK